MGIIIIFLILAVVGAIVALETNFETLGTGIAVFATAAFFICIFAAIARPAERMRTVANYETIVRQVEELDRLDDLDKTAVIYGDIYDVASEMNNTIHHHQALGKYYKFVAGPFYIKEIADLEEIVITYGNREE